jgi:hypothetical protein
VPTSDEDVPAAVFTERVRIVSDGGDGGGGGGYRQVAVRAALTSAAQASFAVGFAEALCGAGRVAASVAMGVWLQGGTSESVRAQTAASNG